MLEQKLAIFGGKKVINKSFFPFNTYNEYEENAVLAVLRSGVLSKYLGCWHEDFYGGSEVQSFEKAWANFFYVEHAIAVNSATSGLIAAVGAIGIEPGDEVIVSPWTMSATATAILFYQGIPVFADIEQDTFNLDPHSVKENITSRTKAIIVSDIFGHAADLNKLKELAHEYKLKIIEDAAQSPGATYYGKYVGTIADIGVFSLNYHKHIHTGEGGMCVTQDPELAERMQLIRNHAEAVVREKPVKNFYNLIGFNFRMGEMEAAIGKIQLKKLKDIIKNISDLCHKLTEGLKYLPGLITPTIKKECSHVFYVYPLVLDLKIVRTTREKIVKALQAEGVPCLSEGYENIHLLPVYQKRIAFGKNHHPWHASTYSGDVSYNKGICPIAENLHDHSFFSLLTTMYDFTMADIELFISAFHKVWNNLEHL